MGKQWKQWLTLFFVLQNHCRWWLQPWNEKMLAPWRKICDQPRQHIKKQRCYFATKVCLVKALVFLVVMYQCESWTIKKAESWRIDAFELWCWRRLLRAPWTGKEIQPVNPKGNQSWIFIGRTDAEDETPILWPPDGRADSLEKTLMLGKIEGKRRRRQQGMRWLNNITDSMDMNLRKLQETVKDREAWHAAFHQVTKNWTRRSNWPTTIVFLATSIRKDMWMLMIFLQIAKLKRFFNFTPSSSYVLYKISTMNCTL